MSNYDTMMIGESPVEEQCAQVGTVGYFDRAMKECNALIAQLNRMHGQPPEGVRLYVQDNPHDFGTYHTVDARFPVGDDAAYEYVLKLEGGLPEYWDATALRELYPDWDEERMQTEIEKRS